jgi:amino acid transporter
MKEAAAPDTVTSPDPDMPLPPSLGMWDAVSIIVGIVVGSAIFKSPTMVFNNVSGPWSAMGVWALGGLLSLIGALCYAELATTYPRSGGDFHYLTKAFGRMFGFLFGWAQLAVILTGSIAIMGYVFADYAGQLVDFELLADNLRVRTGLAITSETITVSLVIAPIVILSIMNVLGVVVGKVLQNFLSLVKVVGLLGIVVVGLLYTNEEPATEQLSELTQVALPASADPAAEAAGTDKATAAPGTLDVEATGDAAADEAGTEASAGLSLGLAMVFVLYAFGGWNDAAFVAAEVRGRRRNLPLALLLGVGLITAIYLLVIYAYLSVLGFEGARQTATPATDVMLRVGAWGGTSISLLVMISALGAINGLILTGSRVYASLGAEHRIFALLGRWNQRRGAPVVSLTTQCAISLLLVVAVGTARGRAAIDRTLELLGFSELPWDKYFGGFETLVAGTSPVFWGFFLLTGLAFFVLRQHDRERPRPFRTPFFPITPIVFCGMCGYMLFSSLDYARGLSIIGLLPLAIGLPLYLMSDFRHVRRPE